MRTTTHFPIKAEGIANRLREFIYPKAGSAIGSATQPLLQAAETIN